MKWRDQGVYDVLTERVEAAIQFGLDRARKHIDGFPTDAAIIDGVLDEVTNVLTDLIDLKRDE